MRLLHVQTEPFELHYACRGDADYFENKHTQLVYVAPHPIIALYIK